jgi:prepilin-type N-terminal cleavage/methylation domain-containing protein
MKTVIHMRNHIEEKPKHTGWPTGSAGFSLIEVLVAMVVFMVAMLGIFVAFTFAISYNAGNNSRAHALAILQQEVEVVRAAKFTPNIVDAIVTGGVKATRTVTSADGNRYLVNITVDDNPSTAGVQINTASTLKEISVTVSLARPTPGWQTYVPATVILRRVISN